MSKVVEACITYNSGNKIVRWFDHLDVVAHNGKITTIEWRLNEIHDNDGLLFIGVSAIESIEVLSTFHINALADDVSGESI